MTKFSIITVCHNSDQTISQTIKSIQDQTFLDYEHIIIDGKSSDNTLKTIKRHQHPRMSVYSEEDTGLYDAMNKGIRRAKGEYLIFLNSDDYFSGSDILSKVHQVSGANPDIIYGGINFFSNRRKKARIWHPEQWLVIKNKKLHLPHPAMFVRRNLVNRPKRYFDTGYQIAADLKQQLQLIHLDGCTGARINEILVQMRLGGKSTGSVTKLLASWQEAFTVYREVFGIKGYFYCSRKIFRKLKQIKVRQNNFCKKQS